MTQAKDRGNENYTEDHCANEMKSKQSHKPSRLLLSATPHANKMLMIYNLLLCFANQQGQAEKRRAEAGNTGKPVQQIDLYALINKKGKV